MREMHIIVLLCLTVAAVLCDLSSGRIPNGIIAAGLGCAAVYQLAANGPAGIIFCLGGILLPLLIFSGLYYFRMIGAGDVKLLCMAGGFLGPSGCFASIVASVVFGGMISLAHMLYRRNFGRRIAFLAAYISEYSRERQWKPYMKNTGEDGKFSFSVPILLGVLCQIDNMK